MSRPQATSDYEEILYEDHIFWYSHPNRLAVLGTLFGMEPAALDRCRVLELGCGLGTNLIAIAQSLPGSRCLGIDLSPRQVASGQALIQTLGLANIELQCLDLQAVAERLGSFDYVIAHGVYSWVPPEVQDRLLSLCARLLAPQGVAYVSYNTYPGWHFHQLIREMLLYHIRPFREARERLRQVRLFLDFLNEAVSSSDSTYGQLVREQVAQLRDRSDAYLYHDHLEAANHPVYFHQFAAHTATHGLQFLNEAHLRSNLAQFSPRVMEILKQIPDLVRQEQYVDFLCNRAFRATLLCHAAVKLQRPPAPERLLPMHVRGLTQPETVPPDAAAPAVAHFRTEDGVALATGAPLLKAVLNTLFEALPCALSLKSLWAGVNARLAGQPEGQALGRTSLPGCVLLAYLCNLVDLHIGEPAVSATAGTHPRASPLARLQAQREQRTANLWHRYVTLSPPHRLVLAHLDSTRDAQALVDALTAVVVKGQFALQHNGQPVRDPEQVRLIWQASLGPILEGLAKGAFLIG